tara:strand:+ start:1242 stop:1631 length:390 start_codon:yes stop_codon:yes gene_type:complete
MIKCKLREMSDGRGPTLKKGRYHGSNFWDIKGFGKEKWVIAAYIDFDQDSAPPWMDEDAIALACVDYLNSPPERKKYEKQRATSLYGTLGIYQHALKTRSGGETYFEVLLTTNERRNDNFWGKGKSDKY